jgi:3-methylfumaryl-CoA hydratase
MSAPFSAWIGRSEEALDMLEPGRSAALLAALSSHASVEIGAPLPLLHHWLYFWAVRPPVELAMDGHPARGAFLPPITLPRRMWAGGRLNFSRPLIIGEQVSRVSTIRGIEEKMGRTGPLIFVTIEHRISGESGLAVVEEQDLVYREAALPGSILPPAETSLPEGDWQRDLIPDPVLLFRYSALTMNGHRIHYDMPYAMRVEAYPGLVVQGPLQATLLADLAARSLSRPLDSFAFKGLSPAFAGAPLHLRGEPNQCGASLWAEQGGIRTMSAIATAV